MLDKTLNISTILRIKLGPVFYRWLFRKKGIVFGKNMSIMGVISVIGSGKIVIGDNFCMTSGEHINPISGIYKLHSLQILLMPKFVLEIMWE